MGNMSYCCMENTYGDFMQAREHLEDVGFEELNDTEQKFCKKLIRAARALAADFPELLEDEDES